MWLRRRRAGAGDQYVKDNHMRQMMEEDLGMRSYRVVKRKKLMPAARRKRQKRSGALINRVKGLDANTTILFQDEKKFTLAQGRYIKNNIGPGSGAHFLLYEQGAIPSCFGVILVFMGCAHFSGQDCTPELLYPLQPGTSDVAYYRFMASNPPRPPLKIAPPSRPQNSPPPTFSNSPTGL